MAQTPVSTSSTNSTRLKDGIDSNARAGAYRFWIEGLLFFSYFVFGLSWIGYSPFLHDFQTQFNLSHASAGLVISSVSFAKIFVPFVAGALALRFGVSRTLLLGMVCICASLLTPFAPNFVTLLASRVVFGVGGALVVTLLGSAVLQWFPRIELPIVNGFNYVAVNSGITLSLFITPSIAQSIGRTTTLLAYAILSLILMLAWLIFGKNGPAAVPRSRSSASKPAIQLYREVLRMREVWLLTIAAAGPLSIYLVFNTWLPTYYHDMLGLPQAQASRLTGLSNLVGIPSAIVGGLLTSRFPKRKPIIVGSGILLGFSAFGLFLTSNLFLLQASAVIFGISLFLWLSPLSTLGMELPNMDPEKLAILNGVFYGMGYVFAFLAPVVTGALRDSSGSFVPGFILFSATAWSLLIAGSMLPETGASIVNNETTLIHNRR